MIFQKNIVSTFHFENSTTSDMWNNFLSIIVDVSNLGQSYNDVKIILDSNKIRIYSIIKSGQRFIAYKDITLNTKDFFIDKIDEEFHWIIYKPVEFKKLFEQLDKKSLINIRWGLSMGDIRYLNFLEARDEKIKLSYRGGDKNLVSHVPVESISEKLNLSPKILKVKLDEEMLKKVQNLSKTTNSTKDDKLIDVISVEIDDNEVFLCDSRWKLKICDTTLSNRIFYFKKSFLKKCKNKEIEIQFYDRFMLLIDDVYNSLIVLELGEL